MLHRHSGLQSAADCVIDWQLWCHLVNWQMLSEISHDANDAKQRALRLQEW